MTNAEAAAALTKILAAGRTITIQCANGDTVTVGQRHGIGTPEAPAGWFFALRWGRSRWALPSGKEIAQDPTANFLAWEVVRAVGRGSVGRACKAAAA